MSALSSRIFGENAKQTLAAAMIAVGMAAPSVAANANEAGADIHSDAPQFTYVQNELIQAKEAVGVRDSRKFDKDVVRTFTARASNDRIAIALYGADADMLNQVRLAAYQAKQRGVDIVGIVIGPTDETKSFDVYADGQRTTTDFDLNDAMPDGMTLQRLAEYTINDANTFLQKIMAKQRQVASLSPVSLEQN